jgi:zinc protease
VSAALEARSIETALGRVALHFGRLDNGLQVLIHPDRSAPVVAVVVGYHVGSAREMPGKSGFAHLFEHLLFQGSKHVASDGHFRHVTQAGGTLNGNTSFDRTLYFETLPANQLELALWLESDRMGWLLDAMTQQKLDNQRDVVRNEKRQNYEQRPYAKAHELLAAALFPTGHPYAHIPIGSHEDLIGATLDDVAQFFRRWYGPNNATLGIGGDVEPDAAFERAAHWFGEIPRGPQVERPVPEPVRLDAPRAVVVEDRVQQPQLTLAWPTPAAGSPDEPALVMLAMVLSATRASILDRALTIDEVLAKSVSCSATAGDVAGRFVIQMTASEARPLEHLRARTFELLERLARDGIGAGLLQRMRTRFEADTVRQHDNVSGRVQELVLSNVMRGDPGAIAATSHRILAASETEIVAALRRHVLEQPPVVLSVVPDGRVELAANARGAT